MTSLGAHDRKAYPSHARSTIFFSQEHFYVPLIAAGERDFLHGACHIDYMKLCDANNNDLICRGDGIFVK